MATEDLKKLKDSAKAAVKIYIDVYKLFDDFLKTAPNANMLAVLDMIRTDDDASAKSIFSVANDFEKTVRAPLTNLIKDYNIYNRVVQKEQGDLISLINNITKFEKYINLTVADCRSSTGSTGWPHHGYDSHSSSSSSICNELGVDRHNVSQEQIEDRILYKMRENRIPLWTYISTGSSIGKSVVGNNPPITLNDVRQKILEIKARIESRRRGLITVNSGHMLLQQLSIIMHDQDDQDMMSLLNLSITEDQASVLRSSMSGANGKFNQGLYDVLTPLQVALNGWNSKNESNTTGTDAASRSMKEVYEMHRRIIEAISAVLVGNGDIRPACTKLRELLLYSSIGDSKIQRTDNSNDEQGNGDGQKPTMGFGHELGKKGNLLPPGRVSGFLFRVIDPVRVNRYLQQASKFNDFMASYRSTDIGEQRSMLEAELETQTQDANALMTASASDDGLAMDEGEMATKMNAIGELRVRAVVQFASQVRDAVEAVVVRHRRFMLQQHAEAARYMKYWQDIAAKSKKVDGDLADKLTEHRKILDEIASTATKRITSNVSDDINIAMEKSLQTGSLRLSTPQYQKIGDTMDSLATWVYKQNTHISRMYSIGKDTLIDSLLQPEVLTIYCLKIVRLFVVWLATTVASRGFQALYRQRVYAEDGHPPHPAVLVAMVIGLDAVAHIIIGTVLVAARTVWKIEASLLQMWALDWALTSVLVTLLSLIVSHVVYSKKYFRYKYEGERGIRALEELMLRIYIVAIPIPFFRLTFG